MHKTKIESGRWYSDKDAAEIYGIGRSTLWSWVSQNKFPSPVKLSSRTTRWSGADLLSWEESIRNNQIN